MIKIHSCSLWQKVSSKRKSFIKGWKQDGCCYQNKKQKTQQMKKNPNNTPWPSGQEQPPPPTKKKKNIPGILGKGKPTKQAQQSPSPCPPPQSDTHSFPTSQVKQLFCVPINISISSFLADVSHVPHYLNNIRHHLWGILQVICHCKWAWSAKLFSRSIPLVRHQSEN